jgi:hypothetical protein
VIRQRHWGSFTNQLTDERHKLVRAWGLFGQCPGVSLRIMSLST